jgi:hypothetical protein
MRSILTAPLDWLILLGVGARYLQGKSDESGEISYLEAEVMEEMSEEKAAAESEKS